MTWIMYAHKRGDLYWDVGDKWWVEIHHLPYPIVKVELTEDSDGIYFGWLDNNKEKPSMIYPHEVLYKICFPYGPEVEEKSGKGRTVRLNIREIEET